MQYEFKITKTHQSRLNEIDFDNIPFGKEFTDHIFSADYIDGKWTNIQIVPFQRISMHPATLALHYGQSIFEGMKASISNDGVPFLFRPELHAERINASARRMCMPEFPEDTFIQACHALVDIDRNWIPKKEGSALYIRPLMYAADEYIGVASSNQYKFLIFALPVGPYYNKAVKLKVERKFIRAADGGVGEAKTAGNYAASLLPAKLAKEAGYDQVLWMDGKEFKYIQEVGTMNIFFVIGNKVITPSTDGSILKGITRLCAIQIIREAGYEVEERKLSIDEVKEAYKNGALKEVFGTGTAAVVAHVDLIGDEDMVMDLDPANWKVSKLVKDEINGLRNGTIKDTRGWIVPVDAMVNV